MDLDVRVYSAKDFNSGNKNPLIPFQPQKQNLPMQGRIRISEANGAPILLLRIKYLLIVNILPLPRQKNPLFWDEVGIIRPTKNFVAQKY